MSRSQMNWALKESMKTAPRQVSAVLASTKPLESKKRKRAEDLAVSEKEVPWVPSNRYWAKHTTPRSVAKSACPDGPKKPLKVKAPYESFPAKPTSTKTSADQEVLGKLEIQQKVTYGKKGGRSPQTLTARLEIRRDELTTCRLSYHVTYHLRSLATDHADEYVADVSGFLIRNSENWKSELLAHPGLNDGKTDCARLLNSLYQKSGKSLWPEVHDDLGIMGQGIMHVKEVYVLDAYQGKGLMKPVLQMFRELLCHDDLQAELKHPGLLLLAPGKFIDKEKNTCWGELKDAQVTEKLSGMYESQDGYCMVVKKSLRSSWETTVMGRMASDSLQAKVVQEMRPQAAIRAAQISSGLAPSSYDHPMFMDADRPAGTTRSGKTRAR